MRPEADTLTGAEKLGPSSPAKLCSQAPDRSTREAASVRGGFFAQRDPSGGEPGLAMDAVSAGLGPLTPGPSPPANPGGEGSQVLE